MSNVRIQPTSKNTDGSINWSKCLSETVKEIIGVGFVYTDYNHLRIKEYGTFPPLWNDYVGGVAFTINRTWFRRVKATAIPPPKEGKTTTVSRAEQFAYYLDSDKLKAKYAEGLEQQKRVLQGIEDEKVEHDKATAFAQHIRAKLGMKDEDKYNREGRAYLISDTDKAVELRLCGNIVFPAFDVLGKVFVDISVRCTEDKTEEVYKALRSLEWYTKNQRSGKSA